MIPPAAAPRIGTGMRVSIGIARLVIVADPRAAVEILVTGPKRRVRLARLARFSDD